MKLISPSSVFYLALPPVAHLALLAELDRVLYPDADRSDEGQNRERSAGGTELHLEPRGQAHEMRGECADQGGDSRQEEQNHNQPFH